MLQNYFRLWELEGKEWNILIDVFFPLNTEIWFFAFNGLTDLNKIEKGEIFATLELTS